jgi:hypothetical protein
MVAMVELETKEVGLKSESAAGRPVKGVRAADVAARV